MPKLVFSQSGFSLAEILVVLAIVSLIGAISIPNLSKFSRSQELSETALNILSLLKEAQANGASGTRCNDNTSVNWRLSVNPGNYTYSLIAACQDRTMPEGSPQNLGFPIFDTPKVSKKFSSAISVANPTSQCASGPYNLIFSPDQVSYSCGDPTNYLLDTKLTSVFTLRLTKNGQTEDINVNPGGSIYR